MGEALSKLTADCCAKPRKPVDGSDTFVPARAPAIDGRLGFHGAPAPAASDRSAPHDYQCAPARVPLRALGSRPSRSAQSARDFGLLAACRRGDTKAIQQLYESGVQIDVEDRDGAQPMHWACYTGHQSTVRFLHLRGVALDVQNKYGAQPIHYACYGGQLEVVQWLYAQGISLDVEDHLGQQPIHWATRNGHLVTAQWLHEAYRCSDAFSRTNLTDGPARPPFSLLWRATSDPGVVGLRWEESWKRPFGTELPHNVAFGAALLEKTRFTEEELAEFDLQGLDGNSYIKAGNSYYKPVPVIR